MTSYGRSSKRYGIAYDVIMQMRNKKKFPNSIAKFKISGPSKLANQIMMKNDYVIFMIIAIGTTVWWVYRNTSSGFLLDGIFVSSVVVSVMAIIASTITWMFISWISTRNKNDAKVITIRNLLTGMLSGYVVAAVFSDGLGPMAGMMIGILASASVYGLISIQKRILNRRLS